MPRGTASAYGVVLALLGAATFGQVCTAATVTVGSESAPPLAIAVAVPISLTVEPGEQVAAVQLDLAFDPDVLGVPEQSGVQAGSAATAADKGVSYSALEAGVIRIVVAGVNQYVIADGTLAVVTFTIPRTTAPCLEPIALDNLLLSDPEGAAVTSLGVNGSIWMPFWPLRVGPNTLGASTLWLVVFISVALVFFRRSLDGEEVRQARGQTRFLR